MRISLPVLKITDIWVANKPRRTPGFTPAHHSSTTRKNLRVFLYGMQRVRKKIEGIQTK